VGRLRPLLTRAQLPVKTRVIRVTLSFVQLARR